MRKAIILSVFASVAVSAAVAALLSWRGLAEDRMVLPIAGIVAGVLVLGRLCSALAQNRQSRPADDNERAAALTLTPPEGQALIYFVREGFVGRTLELEVVIDGDVCAHLRAPHFTCVPVNPGEHQVSIALPPTRASKAIRARTELVALGIGEVIGLVMRMSMGATANTISPLERLDPTALRHRLRGLKMAASLVRAQPVTSTAPGTKVPSSVQSEP